MLEAQANTPLEAINLSDDKPKNEILVNRKNLSELKIPFIYFFEEAVKFGLLKKLGDIEKIKNRCAVYSGYIDRWLAKSIKNKDIKILKDGFVEPKKVLMSDHYQLDNKEESCELLGNISKKITDIAMKDMSFNNPKGISTCRLYSLKNDSDLLIEYKSIVERFWLDMQGLVDKSAKMGNVGGKVHYVSVSTCTIDEGVLSEI